MKKDPTKKKLAVWKFSSCDGCQLSLLDCEDEILAIADAIEISQFLEATRRVEPGPYDLSIVEGSITTPDEADRIQEVRRQSRFVVTIGACATSGGIQALRNFADVKDYMKVVYATPAFIKTLDTSTAIADHIKVDFELRGCPINKTQLLEVLTAFLQDRRPRIANHSVCVECKLNNNLCIAVTRKIPCLGPVTHSGCNALCPTYNRGCFGCYGPKEKANTLALGEYLRQNGLSDREHHALFANFNAAHPIFREESQRHVKK